MAKEIFDKLKLKSGATLKNRIFMAPMTTQSAFYDGGITDEIVKYYEHRAGEAGAIVVESCFVEKHGRGFPGAIGIDSDDKIYGVTKLATAIKNSGSKALIQLYHAGRMAWPEYNGGAEPVAPSPVAALRPNAPVPREMSEEQILAMIQMFADGAKRAIKAGFDGVEIHGANTFIVQQFFSPHSNRREDRWGGNRENRARFAIEVLEAIKKVVKESKKENFIIGYRFSPEELEIPGIRFEDTMYLLNELAKHDLDYVHFSMGIYTRSSIVDTDDPEELITQFLARRSSELAKIPVVGVGGILQRKDVEEALKLGYDIVSVGKGFLIEPRWVSAIKADKAVPDFADKNLQHELLIPAPLWDFMSYMVSDPEIEKAKHERIKKLQQVKLEFKEGSYDVEARGHNNSLPMKVTFSKNKIEKIEVDNSEESEGLSEQVFKRLPKQIIEGQTLNVDAISGASSSSKGLIEGVEEAVKLAGADPEVLYVRPKPVVKWVKEVVEEETDVIIIGGGAAGIASALRADELGLRVTLIEKQSFIGGAISISGGNQVVIGSKLQKELGVTDDTPELMFEDFMKNGNNKNVPELLNLLANNVGQTTDWLTDYVGVEYDLKGGLHVLAEYRKDRELAYNHGGHGFAGAARNKIANSNVRLLLQTKAKELILDNNGNVTGLIAREETGRKHIISAKAVILTTGGYGNNKQLLSKELGKVLFYGTKSSNGEGLVMATKEGVDAATRLMEYGKIYPNGIEVSKGYAKSTIGGNIVVLRENGLLVNKFGVRVVNERASNHDILDVLMEQEDQTLYILLDQEHFDIFKEAVAEGGISEQDIERWLDNNGETTPQFFHADTLEKLAELAHMPQESLSQTVSRYNSFVKNGKDEDFNRELRFLQKEVGSGPYYLVEQKPRFATTMGGLVVNDSLEVVNKKGTVINGLYAAGEVVGGVMGTDSPSGANNAWALTSGKLAAESIKSKFKK
ncbi:flavocytochrome c [Gemella bergeri ATCC 700627]|uniref:Urocanate reductase n=1 Tax=Gemella bergeri ATCC 700627 TaxID=1321820 RepID=U2Q2B1_9BACL|nr:NADH-dependent flavin oxidoreductase [Gemella bergeri]ERK56880.1 flavocytochrome c [Gemella bergeri ATCC 700627]